MGTRICPNNNKSKLPFLCNAISITCCQPSSLNTTKQQQQQHHYQKSLNKHNNHHHHHQKPTIKFSEMLVPRRKGQLLKLLILVPLSLLLFTSIYYQFYYEPPPGTMSPLMAGSMAEPLVAAQADYFSFSEKDLNENNNNSDNDNTNRAAAAAAAAGQSVISRLAFRGAEDFAQQRQKQKQASYSNIDNNNNEEDDDSDDIKIKRPKVRLSYNQANQKFNPMFHNPTNSHHNHGRDELLANSNEAASQTSLHRSSNQSPSSSPSSSHKSPENRDRSPFRQADDKEAYHLVENEEEEDKSTNASELSVVDFSAQPQVVVVADDELPALSRAKSKRQHSNRHNHNHNHNHNHHQDHLNNHQHRQEGAHSSTASSSLNELQREANADQDAAVIPAPSAPNGPGELGRPVVLRNLTKEQQHLVNVGWENNAFNQYVSDIISVNRSLPDVRDPACKQLTYPNIMDLPPTSVIICFHNEAWSVLLRTVHSVLNRSPRHLVKEIILVDDFSDKPHLGQQLEDYMKQVNGVVKIVRASKREGLIRARLLGARAATAPVLTFLDSHCECAEGWIEPLLGRIHEDSRAVVCPVIDVISDKTFEYHYKGDANSISVGGFDWNLQFNWHSIPEHEKKRRKHAYDPLRSPTMAGGLFSIDRSFFERLGTYDSGFDIWGGENLELSFKTWMCGGTLEIIPCSHVGHVFRSRSPYKWRTGVNVLRRNSVRLAEVWMDDYKKYYYDRIGHDLGDFGDVSERAELRKGLHCKPFSYFVKEIYPELFIPGEAIAYGEIRNEAGHIKMCLDSSARKTDYHKPLGLYPCHGAGGNQYWLLSRDGEIRRDEACVDYAGKDVVLFPCHGSGGNQLWLYDSETQLIRHSTSGRCMELAQDRIHLKMSDCDPSIETQKWTFQHYNATLAAQYSQSPIIQR